MFHTFEQNPGRSSSLISRSLILETGATEEWTVSPNVVAGFRDLGVSVSTEPLAWSPDFRAIFFAGTSRAYRSSGSLDVDPDGCAGFRRAAPDGLDGVRQRFGVTAARTTRAIAFSAAARLRASGRIRSTGPGAGPAEGRRP